MFAADLFQDDATNQASPVARIEGTEAELTALFTTARDAYTNMTKAGLNGTLNGAPGDTLCAAIQSGKAADLIAALHPPPKSAGR